MQLIYERLMGGSGQDTLGVLIDFTPEEEDSRYINTVVEGVAEHVNELDALIASYSPSREIDRIARVDLCILRVALYEMRYCADTPESVAINEAVKLSKKYGTEDTPAYINGVLSSLEKSQ